MTFQKDRDKSLIRLKDNFFKTDLDLNLKNILINNLYINSFLYRLMLIFFGFKVGKNSNFKGPINFILNGPIKNIEFGDYILFGKNITLKIRENGKIKFHDKVYLDNNVRLVAAREGLIEINEGTHIGANTIINSGGIVKIGKYCLISNNCNINSSSHGTKKNNYIKDQPHSHGITLIDNDVWLGGFVSIAKDSNIGEGAIIGANSFVNSLIDPFSISVGCPAKKIDERR